MTGRYPDIKNIEPLAVQISADEDLNESVVDIGGSDLSSLREIILVVGHKDRVAEAVFAEGVEFSESEAIAPFTWWRGWIQGIQLFKGCTVRVVEAKIV
jgi:hypothetical protein